jgi:uncharacterized protein YjbI with pentapeptide repeats
MRNLLLLHVFLAVVANPLVNATNLGRSVVQQGAAKNDSHQHDVRQLLSNALAREFNQGVEGPSLREWERQEKRKRERQREKERGRERGATLPPSATLSNISWAEMRDSIRAGTPIEHRYIDARFIEGALSGAPRGLSETDRTNTTIIISKSIIVGTLELVAFPQSFPQRVPIRELPPELSTPYQRERFQITKEFGLLSVPEELGIVSPSMLVEDSTFDGDVDLSFAVFCGRVKFDNVKFKGFLNCEASIFASGVNFSNVSLIGDLSFSSATFGYSMTFYNTEFGGDTFFHNTFFGYRGVHFEASDFEGKVDFQNSNSQGQLIFYKVVFKNFVSFGKANLTSGGFRDVFFQEDSYFGQISFLGELFFVSTVFLKNVFFSDLNKEFKDSEVEESVLGFQSVDIRGHAYFDNSKIGTLKCATNKLLNKFDQSPQDSSPRPFFSPTVFGELASFRSLECNSADLSEAVFRNVADFSRAHFAKAADFSYVTFQNNADFRGADFPPSYNSLILKGVRFEKVVNLSWDQIKGRVNAGGETWEDLEDAFKRSANLEGQNEAVYQRRLSEGYLKSGWDRVKNNVDKLFWGFGVRPFRLAGWITLLFLLFTFLYWSQTKALAVRERRWRSEIDRLVFALRFSLRTTWTLGYGFRNARTSTFKVLTLAHSLGFKLLLLCLLKVMANTLPLLNEIVSKLVKL